MKKGFTLIEMSIVLVIIGLIIGGVLLGRDLISAAAVRAQSHRLKNTMRRSILLRVNMATCRGIFLIRMPADSGLRPEGRV